MSLSSILTHSLPKGLHLPPSPVSLPQRLFTATRHASLTSAINRGIRRSQYREDEIDGGRAQRLSPRLEQSERSSSSRGARDVGRSRGRGRREHKFPWEDENNGNSSGSGSLRRRYNDNKDTQFENRRSFAEERTGRRGGRDRGRDQEQRPYADVLVTRMQKRSEGEERQYARKGRGGREDRDRDERRGNRGMRREDRSPRFEAKNARQPREREARGRDERGSSYPPFSSNKRFDEEEFIRTGQLREVEGNAKKVEVEAESRRRERDDLGPSARVRSTRPGNPKRRDGQHHHISTDAEPERVKKNVLPPSEVPYTTPASQFIFGTAAVEAALRCSRRQLYKLYIYQAEGERLSEAKSTLRKLALEKLVPVKMAFGDWDRLLDKMSAGRPHNGVVLDASPLPQLPVTYFHFVHSVGPNIEPSFRVELGAQSREEAAVNGLEPLVPINRSALSSSTTRQRDPVVVLLDGIQDPGNLGAIIRSAYFLGIDAVVLAGRNSAPLSAVTIKASAGAAENMPLLQVRNERDFIAKSKENGWRFYAAAAPGPGAKVLLGSGGPDGASGLPQAPSVIMMGSEGDGLSPHLLSAADAVVGIPGARLDEQLGVAGDPARVDSLNVSVAAALLFERFLQSPVMLDEAAPKTKRRTGCIKFAACICSSQ
ncbi:TrmH family RNA methyltransferase [Aspergillus homomorphus CBS 101889]|uniref:rRNA methyltransferase 1, mitochondrial n=1 Tax=Aspergillus homomorphus (strain CBS 101889) TaxID=1450537 RepID=A0A395I1U1_ASPHC|nr:hypothetical protein BO97DRAFT_477394 [Aspergillus homomorphus CBS 101889]RAL13138.1 hypothetical protein BO97DRAFT_477394 [Aspergillus homomorphus CBS 101889]